jgi:hypothetical protein
MSDEPASKACRCSYQGYSPGRSRGLGNDESNSGLGKSIIIAKSTCSFDLDKINIYQSRMLFKCCERRYLTFIAQNNLLVVSHEAEDVEVEAKKEELHEHKFRLLKVLFSEDLFDDVVKMNDKKHENELDSGKVGNQRLWRSIAEAYNDSA